VAGQRSRSEPVLAEPDSASASYELALVLSGGGARGFAHVGVLQVVERLQLPIDLVVGVSMGSIVGAGFAAGVPPEQMCELAGQMSVQRVFRPRPGRLGLVDPVGMRDALGSLFGAMRIEDLGRPLAIVSSSLVTGRPVVIREGLVVDALLASCAIPLIFPPVSREDDHLLDGGLIEALPTEVAQALGARRVIAVDASSHVRHVFRVPGVRHATRRVAGLLGRRRTDLDAVQIAARILHHAAERPPAPPADILIRPAFGFHSSFHYHRSAGLVEQGREAAEAVRDQLIALGQAAQTGERSEQTSTIKRRA